MIDATAKLDPAMLTEHCCVHIETTHNQAYLGKTPLDLAALFVRKGDTDRCVVTTDVTSMRDAVARHHDDEPSQAFDSIAAMLEAEIINLSAPLKLSPVYIPKPWGQEIWFTGIEERGVSEVQGVPLSWLLDLFGELLAGRSDPPILLKILDPLATDNLGDLYFELHERKTEVYVVTKVDESAWEGGVGAIRYGFNRDRMQEFSSREEFFEAYLDSVDEYKAVRDRIDAGEVNDHLTATEERLRHAMYEFTSMHPLHVGDVVRVEPFVPHSLQHGVRVVEFQTPHYERHILSFGQKVLTQDGWDTVEAVAMVKDDPADITTTASGGVETIADFEEFDVSRVMLEPGESETIAHTGYKLVMGVFGQVSIDNTRVESESAYYLPRGLPVTLLNDGDGPACVLVAGEKD